MGSPPQDETPHLYKRVRPLEDDQLDRREVEAQQCVQLTRTNGRGLFNVMRGDGVSGATELKSQRERYKTVCGTE